MGNAFRHAQMNRRTKDVLPASRNCRDLEMKSAEAEAEEGFVGDGVECQNAVKNGRSETGPCLIGNEEKCLHHRHKRMNR